MVRNEERKLSITDYILHWWASDSGTWHYTEYQIGAWRISDYISGLQFCNNLESEFWKYDLCIICNFCNDINDFTFYNE